MKYILPKPIYDDVFEDIVCDVYSKIFLNSNLQRYGRSGQKQHGIDIIGKDYKSGKLQVIQCKCHPDDSKITDSEVIKELDNDLAKFDKSGIESQNYIFVTSTNRSTQVQDHVMKLNTQRTRDSKCNVEVVFWDFVQKELTENTDLLYRYFFKLLPNTRLEAYNLPDINQKVRTTLKLSYEELVNIDKSSLQESLMGCLQETLGEETFNATTEYALSLGLHSNNNDFENTVDLDICFKSLFKEEEKVEEKLQQITEAINKLCDVINADKKISKQIIVYSDSEISFAFLLGIILRKRKYFPIFIFKQQAWNVDNTLLSHTPANIKEQPPEIFSPNGKEVVFVFSCTPTFNFHTEYVKVLKLVESNKGNIRFLLGFTSSVIANSAHAFSVSNEIASKLNSLSSWGIDTVHLILITPKPIAGLIGYQLNTLNLKIIPYFLNKDRDTYLSVGKINNNLLR